MHHVNTLLLSTAELARKPHLSHVCQFAEMLPSVQTQAHCRCLCYGLPYAVQFASAGRMCQIFVNAAQCRRPGVHLTPPLQCMKANCVFAQPQSVCEMFAQSKLEQGIEDCIAVHASLCMQTRRQRKSEPDCQIHPSRTDMVSTNCNRQQQQLAYGFVNSRFESNKRQSITGHQCLNHSTGSTFSVNLTACCTSITM